MPALDAYTMHVIAAHGGRAVVSIEEAAKVAGVSVKHARRLTAEHRFPVFGTTSSSSARESVSVLLPALVAWMNAGGTRQYDALPTVPTLELRKPRTVKLDWLAAVEAA